MSNMSFQCQTYHMTDAKIKFDPPDDIKEHCKCNDKLILIFTSSWLIQQTTNFDVLFFLLEKIRINNSTCHQLKILPIAISNKGTR